MSRLRYPDDKLGRPRRTGTAHAPPTAKQRAKISVLEQATGSAPKNLDGWTRMEASDYITILEHRSRKGGTARYR